MWIGKMRTGVDSGGALGLGRSVDRLEGGFAGFLLFVLVGLVEHIL